MLQTNYFESIGTIVKKEKLATFYPGYKCRCLVLESIEPFPGYYCMIDYQFEQRPLLLYLVIKDTREYDPDHVVRATMAIKNSSSLVFDAAPSDISLFNRNYHAIRLDIPNISQLPEIVTAFEGQGLVLHKHIDVKPYDSLIRIRRYFKIEKEADNLYHDLVHIENHYVILPKMLTWEEFEPITYHIKHNIDFSTFDAALGFVFNETSIVDFVRVYVKNPKLEDLLKIRDMYLREVSRMKV